MFFGCCCQARPDCVGLVFSRIMGVFGFVFYCEIYSDAFIGVRYSWLLKFSGKFFLTGSYAWLEPFAAVQAAVLDFLHSPHRGDHQDQAQTKKRN